MAHQTYFKHDQETRVDDRLGRDRDDGAAWRAVCRQIDLRDRRQCRACEARTNPDAIGLLRGHRHHLIYRSAGGESVPENLCTVCAACHNDLHRHRLRIEGNPEDALTFWRCTSQGRWYVWRQEIAVGVWARD